MIGIIGAMQEEVNEILNIMDNYKSITKYDATFYKGQILSKDVIVCLAGIGKVRSSLSVSVLVNEFNVDKIINIGTAGGLLESQNELDIIVATKLSYHDFELDVLGWTKRKGFTGHDLIFNSDPKFVKIMENIAKESQHKFWIGPMVSGDMFVNKKEQVDKILSEFPEALASEMESASVAHSCTFFKIPFIIIRSLSYITVKEGNSISFEEYLEKASKNSAIICKKFIEQL